MKRNILGLHISVSGLSCGSTPNIFTMSATPTSPENFKVKSYVQERPKSAGYDCREPKTPVAVSNNPKYFSLSPSTVADRFIPNRLSNNFELSGHNLLGDTSVSQVSKNASELRRRSPITDDILKYKRVISFASPTRNSNEDQLRKSPVPSPKTCKVRRLPRTAENVLDAPGLVNNFFINAIDFGKCGLLAAALENKVYTWNPKTGDTNNLYQLKPENDEVTAVRWSQDGSQLAASTKFGNILTWDDNMKFKGTVTKHNEYVTALVWNKNIISSGDALGFLHHTDGDRLKEKTIVVRVFEDILCGLAWSPNGRFLVTGSSNGAVKVWDGFQKVILSVSEFHTAAVKAVTWCPWSSRVFVTGGGLKDQTLRLWTWELAEPSSVGDVSTTTEDTKSQVCDIVWPKHHKEIITCHGAPEYKISFWQYPSLNLLGHILGHQDRVLSLTISPDGMFLVSASADETIRLWECFSQHNPKGRRNEEKSKILSVIR